MSLAVDLKRRFTWDDYQRWPEDERWELIDGEAFAAAAPSTRHQSLAHKLGFHLEGFLKPHKCDVFPAPTDVRLSDLDVVQPDLLVVCDDDQIKETHIEGPPTLVVEIISASSAIRDRHDKMALYAKHGVKECWLVTPFPAMVEVFVLDGDTYRWFRTFTKEETLESPSFPDLTIPLADVFTFPLTDEERELFVVRESPAQYKA